MKLILSTHNVTLTKAIEDHIMTRINKFDHLDRFAIDARVTLEHDHRKAPEKQFSCSMRLRARVVLPVAQPPIDDGAVLVSGQRIEAVGRWKDLRSRGVGPVVHLGGTILMPGLVNAHCHLDYTDMAREIAPTKRFTDWIKTITMAKAGRIYADFAQSWVRGAQMLLRTGTTTVADIEAVPELLPEVWQAT